MNRVRSVEIREQIGERVRVAGWLQHHRRHGRLSFLVLRDGWGTVQAVSEAAAQIAQLEQIGLESVITIEGRVVAMPQAPDGVELHDIAVAVVTAVDEPPPVTLNKKQLNTTLPTLLDHAAVANRHVSRRAILRLAAGIMAGFRQTLGAHHFTEIQSPKLVASATESGANVFELAYFGRPAYLAQSPQFYKQIMVGVFERVFEVGPVFRAEPHNTSRHISQYVSMDVEFGFIENHFTVMSLLEEVMVGVLSHLAVEQAAELARLGVMIPQLIRPFPHIHFRDAKALVTARQPDIASDPFDLSPAEERWLGDWAKSEHGSEFLFVTGYPMAKRPFYTHPDPKQATYSNSFDLLFRGVELVTGGQRRHRYSDYLTALAEAKLPLAPFEPYLEAFRFGMPPHGGFAIGLERLVMQLLGLSNIRLATLFPRDVQRLTP